MIISYTCHVIINQYFSGKTRDRGGPHPVTDR